ncbi:MAG: hypothetical protein HZA48_06200 [Planctomycetes bacterium]|nr:hypothetical protein [Planctomycetota bacterium]
MPKMNLSRMFDFSDCREALKKADELAAQFSSGFEKDFVLYSGLFADDNNAGNPDCACMYMEDLSSIPFLDNIPGIEYYQLRARLLSGSNDLVALSYMPDPAYERYNRIFLGLGEPEFLTVCPDRNAPINITRNILESRGAIGNIVDFTKSRGALNIHPYMGSREVWELALQLRGNFGADVRVTAPLPGVTEMVNDKSQFVMLVQAMLSADDTVETCSSNALSHITDALKTMALRYDKIVLKIGNYASAMGNILFDSEQVKMMDKVRLRAAVRNELAQRKWDGSHNVCVMEWRTDVLGSPSAQLWIPRAGFPVVEGIFDQLLAGPEKVFNGSTPSRMPERLKKEFARKAFNLGLLFQRLGYFGRCSFDAIVCGRDLGDAAIKFVECNGRWGGTSLPMSLCNRIFGSHLGIRYIAKDVLDKRLRGCSFGTLLKIFEGRLYDCRTGSGDFILYNTGCLEKYGKFDMIALGDIREETEYKAFVEVPEMLDDYFADADELCRSTAE